MPRWTPFPEHFWAHVNKTDGCWEWTGNLDSHGYGRVHYKQKRRRAHRVVLDLLGIHVPDHLLACHSCDNKKCVNPDHIFIGTHKDNMQDWTKKGKNRLANDRSLWAMGRHWATNDVAKEKLRSLLKEQIASGKRVVIRGEKGRILGTRMST